MTDTLSWLFWLVVIACGYAGLMLGLDRLFAWWQQHQRLTRQRITHRAELARIDRDAYASVQRISSAFMVAQQLIREHADAERRWGRS
jgi:hypothetical protein